MKDCKRNTPVEASMHIYLLLKPTKNTISCYSLVTLAVAMAEVDVLMMLLFNNYNLSGTQLEALMPRGN